MQAFGWSFIQLVLINNLRRYSYWKLESRSSFSEFGIYNIIEYTLSKEKYDHQVHKIEEDFMKSEQEFINDVYKNRGYVVGYHTVMAREDYDW